MGSGPGGDDVNQEFKNCSSCEFEINQGVAGQVRGIGSGGHIIVNMKIKNKKVRGRGVRRGIGEGGRGVVGVW